MLVRSFVVSLALTFFLLLCITPLLIAGFLFHVLRAALTLSTLLFLQIWPEVELYPLLVPLLLAAFVTTIGEATLAVVDNLILPPVFLSCLLLGQWCVMWLR